MNISKRLLNSIPTWIVGALIIGITAWCCYSFQPSWDFSYAATWWILGVYVSAGIMMVVAPFVASSEYNDAEEGFFAFAKTLLVPVAIAIILTILMIIFGLCNGEMTKANERFDYVKENVTITNESLFPNLVGENGDTSHIPVIEDTEAYKKANAAIAEGSLGNKNSINEASLTSQEINGRFVYTISLKPNSWFKWDGKTKGYLIIDRNSGETKLVKDEFVYSIDAKYGNFVFHGTNNVRKLLIEKLGGKWVDKIGRAHV